jgi:hypothetical protein
MFGIGVVFTVAGWRTRTDPGITTEVALLATYALGVLALPHQKLTAAPGVVVALLLASLVAARVGQRRLSDREVLDGILLAAAARISASVAGSRFRSIRRGESPSDLAHYCIDAADQCVGLCGHPQLQERSGSRLGGLLRWLCFQRRHHCGHGYA